MILRVFSLISFIAFELCVAQQLPLPVTTCHQDSPDFSVCLKRGLQEAWSRLAQGFPEFDFPSLDPLIYHYRASFESNSLNADITVSNSTAVGLAKTRILDVRSHFFGDRFRIELDLDIPKLYLEGIMAVKGNLGPFRMDTNPEKFNLSIIDVKATCNTTGNIVNDKVIIEHFNIVPEIGNLKIYFKLLRSKELNDFAVQFINENWPAYYQGITSSAISRLEPWLIDLINRWMSKIFFFQAQPT
ncbi:uncharacterized protein LOC105279372 [Ooceraea biroi]|uniref:uncharacterized protein LOC105279372 n=1 Tax=Ooceraea biroi TaxID=2015173 RepID=UPI000F082DBC|nr:uncharacterized protein LOC105279372 [Ooceraea biroi]